MKFVREKIVKLAEGQLGKPYVFGVELNLDDDYPKSFDCSEFVQWLFHKNGLTIPDGSKAQYDFTSLTMNPLPGDLGFFGDDKRGIYHVGMIFDDTKVIEARGYPYNKVIFRPRIAWNQFGNFKGWRSHPELIEEA